MEQHDIIPETHLASLHCVLGLQRQVVGVTFFANEDAYQQSSVTASEHPLSYCSLVRMATAGYARKAGYAQIRCSGARRALGLSRPEAHFLSGERYLSLGLYENLALAEKTANRISLMPADISGFAVQPLSSCAVPPDIVIVICNPYQAMRIVQGYIYRFEPTQAMTSLGMQGVCAELTARPYRTGVLNVSLLCSNTRFSCAWADTELGVGLPSSQFAATVDGIVRTVNATEPNRRKQEILKRCTAAGVPMDINLNSSYF